MRRFVLALICLALLSPAFAQDFVEIKTPHFTVVTDLGEAKGRDIAERFEQVRSAFGLFFNKENLSVPLPLTIVAFKNARDFQQFVPKFVEKSHPLWHGTVRHGEDENLIAFDTVDAAEGRRASASLNGMEFAFREYVKLLIGGNFPPVPTWYENGVLEYCSSLKITNKQIVYGVQRPDLLSVLQTQPWLRGVQLFGPAPAAAADDWEAERHTIFYAQSWVTMHYLMANNLGRQLNVFVDLLQNQHVETQEAIRRAFGVEPKSFENAVRNYFTLHMTEYKMAEPADFGKGSFTVRKLREGDWMATWADLHYHSPRDHDLGVEMFNKVLATDPNNASARRGAGFAFLQRNEFDKAEAHFLKALASDPDDPRVHYFLALTASKRAHAGGAVDLAAVKQHLQRAIALNPAYADAYQVLSWAESELKNTDAAHAAIEKATALNPRNDFFALTAAQFDLQAKQFDKARPVLERLQSSDQPEVSRFAHQALAGMGPRQDISINSPRQQITAPQWRDKTAEDPVATEKQATAPQETPAPEPKETKIASILFMKGELLAVDCSKSPMVTLTVWSKGKSFVLFSRDVNKLPLIGVENFSCNWTNKKASANYRLQADGRGELVSLEID